MNQPMHWLNTLWDQCKNAATAGQLAHALIVTGQARLGQGAFARRLGRWLLCLDPQDAAPCGQCSACHLMQAETHPDWHLCVPEKEGGQIGVDAVRALIEALSHTAHHAERKVAIIEPADRMTNEAANALLKTLEEPPGQRTLFLVTDRPARLPATIRSRCRLLTLPTPDHAGFADAVQALGVECETMQVLYTACDGIPLKALDVLDQDAQMMKETWYGKLMTTDVQDFFAWAGQQKAQDLRFGLPVWQALLADCLRIRSGLPLRMMYQEMLKEQIVTWAKGMSAQQLSQNLKTIGEHVSTLHAGISLSPAMLLESIYLTLNKDCV